jgi:hypothetical protein
MPPQSPAQLKKMGFDDGAVQRAGDGLKPKFSHKTQIERITGRLGLAADSDVTKLWIELNETYGPHTELMNLQMQH